MKIESRTELGESAMGFQLPDGKLFLLNKDDVKKIADEFWVQMILNKRTHVYMIEDIGIKRAQELYKIFVSEKKTMSPKMKDEYLSTILKHLGEERLELTTLDKLIKDGKSPNPKAKLV